MVEAQPRIGDLLLIEENPTSRHKNLAPEALVGAWTKEYVEMSRRNGIYKTEEESPLLWTYEEMERVFREYGKNLVEDYRPAYLMGKVTKEKFMGFIVGAFHGAYDGLMAAIDYDYYGIQQEIADSVAYAVIRKVVEEIREKIN